MEKKLNSVELLYLKKAQIDIEIDKIWYVIFVEPSKICNLKL